MNRVEGSTRKPQITVVPSHLPPGVYEFWAAFPRSTLPDYADLIWQVVNTAVRKQSAKEQRTAFNRGIRGLKSQKREPLKDFQAWLNSPEVFRSTGEAGLFWAHRKWWLAIESILKSRSSAPDEPKCRSLPAHAAFGGDKPGRPTSPGFGGAELVAAYVLLHDPPHRLPVEKMIADWSLCSVHRSADHINEREVRRVLDDSSHFVHTLSEEDLRALALGLVMPKPKDAEQSD
jgi:hypothetical protein